MRTLTAPATLVTGRANAEPLLLVTLTTVSGTVFKLSDCNRVIEGVEYLGLIQNPQDLTEALNDFDGGGAPATATLVLSNALAVGGKARFSDLIQTPRNLTGTYEFRNARVDIDRLENGQALANAIRLQSFYLEAPNEIGDSLITLQMCDLALKIEDGLPIGKVTRAVFPKCPPSAIEQEIRRPFGRLTRVKATPVKDGAEGDLDASITDTDVSIALVDGTDFSVAGTGLIESEFFTWTGKTGLHTLTGVTRAALGTTAVAHDAGTTVHEILPEYVFIVGEGIALTEKIGATILSDTFDSTAQGWAATIGSVGTVSWDSGNGGQLRLSPGLGTVTATKDVAVTPLATYQFKITIRTATTVVTITTGGITIYTQSLAPGSYTANIRTTAAVATITALQGSVDSFLDDVQLIQFDQVTTTLPGGTITNVRINGRAARTSPTLTAADATLAPNRNFGTIKFTPANVPLFHTLPQGQQETFTPAAISVTGDGVTNVNQTRVITPTTGVAEVGTRTRRIITVTIKTTTDFTATNFWHLARYLTSKGPGSAVQIGSGQGVAGNTTGQESSVSHTIEYPTDGSETIVFSSLLGSAKVITCTFEEAYVTYLDGASGAGSTSAAVIGEVTCDLQGIQDDANGVISGQANSVIENPADVTRAILYLMGLASSDFDASWAATRAIMTNAGYKWASLLGAHQFSDLRRIMSEQARARLIMTSGKVGLRFRAYRPAADITFQYGSAVPADKVAQALSVKLTSPTELIDGLTVRYAYDDAKGDFQKSLTFGDPVAAAAVSPMELAFVADDGTARDIGAYWYGFKRRPRFAVDGIAWHNALALEQGDHFAVKGQPAMVAHGDNALVFALNRKADKGGKDGIGQIALGGLEDTIEGDVGPEDTSMAWGSRAGRGKNNAATPNTKWDQTADAVILRNSSNLIIVRHNPGSLTCDVGAAGPVANGRDQAGAFTASTFVHFYWIWDPVNGVLALLSSATAPPTGPTLPTNFTYWSYIGPVYFDGSSHLVRTTINGCWVQRANVELTNTAVTVNTEQSFDGSAIWPANALAIGGTWSPTLNAASDTAALRAESGVDSGIVAEASGASTTGSPQGFELNVTGQTLYYIQSANASRALRIEVSRYKVGNGGE